MSLVVIAHGQVATRHSAPGVARQLPTFFARPKKVGQERPPRFAAHFVGTLRCSPAQAAAELALRAQTVLAETS